MDENELSVQENEGIHKSQVEPTPFVISKLKDWEIGEIKTPEDLLNLGQHLNDYLKEKPYNEETKEDEKNIRWRRTGSEVLEEGYVYEGKACTDVVVALITLARAAGIEDTSFVKLVDRKRDKVHSVGEFRINGIWYTYNVAYKGAKPTLGKITEAKPFGTYTVWKRGRDSWEIGLNSFESEELLKS